MFFFLAGIVELYPNIDIIMKTLLSFGWNWAVENLSKPETHKYIMNWIANVINIYLQRRLHLIKDYENMLS